MAYEVNFAGVNLSDYCTVLNIERSVLPPRENFSKTIPTMHGSYYTGYRYGERAISLEVYVKAPTKEEYVKKVRRLADVLHTENPCKLTVSDEPGKYYYAVVDGETALEKTVFSGTLTINFICHDPVAYSDEWKTFEPNSKNIVALENNGTTDTNMSIDVEFNSDACFFQATKNKGETVRIGKPKQATKQNTKLSNTVVNDKCELSSTFTALPEALLDSKRTVTGNYAVGHNGIGIVCSNFGTSAENTWTGAAFKRALGKNVEEFEVSIDFIFSSKGTNYSAGSGASSLGTYQVTAKAGLIIRSSNSTKSTKLAAMPYGTKINATEISGKWIKHTTKVGSKTYTGYSHSDYLKKVSSSKSARATEYAEDELGLLEVYGYDQNGAKLFKAQVDDANQYYEYVKPRVYVGTSKVLADDASCPSPRKVVTKDKDGKTTKTESAASGTYGKWNDLDGKFVIKRTKDGKGKYLWTATLYRYKGGEITQTIKTANSLSNSSYPTGALNYLGFYIGRYGSERPVDVMTITHINVKDLSPAAKVTSSNNEEIFDDGDRLHIDFETGLVTLNKKECLSYIDIGSEFFSTPTGYSEIAIKTDDKKADIVCGFQERYL